MFQNSIDNLILIVYYRDRMLYPYLFFRGGYCAGKTHDQGISHHHSRYGHYCRRCLFLYDPLLDVICYILTVGIGLAFLFTANASSGGLDIVAKLMNKFLHMDLGKAMSLSGMLVALSAAFVYDTKTVVLSVLGTYFGGILMDHFLFGLNIKRRVCVISQDPDKTIDFILHELHSGATIYQATGAYQDTRKKEIITIVDNQEYMRLMDYIRKNDPTAFVTVISVNEVRYQPKQY